MLQNPREDIGFNIFISNQFIQYNTIFNHTNIRIRTEARAYQVLLIGHWALRKILSTKFPLGEVNHI